MSCNTRRYDAMPLGMGVRVRQRRSVERVLDGRDLYG
jgi:hypothetical protein